MTTSLASALTLMVIGMITVFVVLLLVYLTGNLLIRLVNRWSPEPAIATQSDTRIPEKQIAVITAAVEAVSKGKARITNIQKR